MDLSYHQTEPRWWTPIALEARSLEVTLCLVGFAADVTEGVAETMLMCPTDIGPPSTVGCTLRRLIPWRPPPRTMEVVALAADRSHTSGRRVLGQFERPSDVGSALC